MPLRPVPLSEVIASLSEDDQRWVAEESARLIAEEYARRAALGLPPHQKSSPRGER